MQKSIEVVDTGLGSKPHDIKLKSEESHLSFTWVTSDGTHDLPLSLLLSTNATSGSILSTSVPKSIHGSLFGISRFLDHSIKELLCCIVACNSGEVFLIDLFAGGSFVKLCHSQGSVVYADFVTISDYKCLYLLERIGQLCIGTFNHNKKINVESKDVFRWQSLSLSMSPICCITMESSLVMADGHASYLCILTRNSKSLIWECEEMSLPFWGVVRLEKKDIVVILTTCDGRVYRKTLLELNHYGNTENSKEIPSGLGNLDLADAMAATKRCSEIIKDRSSKLSRLNLYLEQLSIAYLLLPNTPKNLFNIDFKLENSLEREGSYLLLLDLQFISQNFKLKGPWWQLSIKLKDCSTVNYIYSDISELFSSKKARYHIYISPVVVENLIKIKGNYSLSIIFDIVFCHFLTQSPIVIVNVHQETIDLIHFLTLQRNDNVYNFPFPDFKKSINKIFSVKSFAKVPKIICQPLISSYCKDSVLIFEKHLPAIQKLFIKDCNSSDTLTTTMLWLRNLSITLTCNKISSNVYKIVLESSSKSFVVAIKIAIVRRALQNYKINVPEDLKITLPSAVLCNTNVCKLLLDLETSQTPSQFVVQRLYESVNNLISSIPL